MKQVLRALVTATTAVAVMAAPAAATAAPQDADRGRLQSDLDEVVAAAAIGALAQVRSEHGVWRGASGVAEVGRTRAVPANGRFRVGSITKTFLATVVLQLVDEGELRLEDTVDSWLPGVVPNGHHITVRHLLNHTSGLYDVIPTLPLPPDPAFLDNRWRTWTADELVARTLANPPVFDEPGSAFSYSNTGYILLGQIIEKATGTSYAEQIEHRLIRPLRLDDTWLPGTSTRIRGPHPHGYVPISKQNGGRQLVDYTQMNPSVFGAAGEMISTTKDLNRFFAVLLSGRLLPGHLLDEMKTPGVESRKYGLGLAWRDTPCGIRVYGNDGDALAYQAYSFSTQDGRRQVTVAVTPNHDGDIDDAADAFVDKAICG
ncbi:serine hydrolase domain-containing protein [Micromonospora sp. CA-240977]|uniref:serine hydrolase domain-containing protein n=1 Tax=Micromonospora sp. CA-240977 TaxID=3239957 RepID=UPI003D933E7E